MRLIDADALFAEFENVGWYNNADRDEIAEPLILQSPTIDAVSVVRCAECKRVREDGGHANCNGYLYCRKWKTLVDEDCYCSWGEREGE